MAALNQDFEMFAGEDKQVNFTITDEKGDPVVLANSQAIWIMANILSTPVFKMTKTIASGGITIKDNVYQVFIDSEDTTNINGKYKHELRMTNADGKETVVAVGQAVIHASLTYPTT
jgi:hypothetical protein